MTVSTKIAAAALAGLFAATVSGVAFAEEKAAAPAEVEGEKASCKAAAECKGEAEDKGEKAAE